jgi:lipopolysaccharide export LptBFGC system permease protein LptF
VDITIIFILIEFRLGVNRMAQLMEAAMVVCFGISWPTSIIKSYTSRTSKGKSIIFICFILIGYLFGIASKIMAGKLNYVLVFYIINIIMVFIDLCLYIRNRKLDMVKGKVAM